MLAVIKTGGKQYAVYPGQKVRIEKLNGGENEEVVFDQVLLLEKQNKLEIGAPLVEGVKVVGKILRQGKGEKIIIGKFKAKKRYHKKQGHRQRFTEVEIKEIQTK